MLARRPSKVSFLPETSALCFLFSCLNCAQLPDPSKIKPLPGAHRAGGDAAAADGDDATQAAAQAAEPQGQQQQQAGSASGGAQQQPEGAPGNGTAAAGAPGAAQQQQQSDTSGEPGGKLQPGSEQQQGQGQGQGQAQRHHKHHPPGFGVVVDRQEDLTTHTEFGTVLALPEDGRGGTLAPHQLHGVGWGARLGAFVVFAAVMAAVVAVLSRKFLKREGALAPSGSSSAANHGGAAPKGRKVRAVCAHAWKRGAASCQQCGEGESCSFGVGTRRAPRTDGSLVRVCVCVQPTIDELLARSAELEGLEEGASVVPSHGGSGNGGGVHSRGGHHPGGGGGGAAGHAAAPSMLLGMPEAASRGQQ